jgi:hypothetical protein
MRPSLFLPFMALSGLTLAGPPIIGCDKPGSSPITNFNFTGPADNTTKTLTSVYWEIPGFGITCAQANATITDADRYLINCTINTFDPFTSWLTFSNYPGLEDTLDPSFFLYTYCDPNWYIDSYQGIFKFRCDVNNSVRVCVPQDGASPGVVLYHSQKMLGPPEGA